MRTMPPQTFYSNRSERQPVERIDVAAGDWQKRELTSQSRKTGRCRVSLLTLIRNKSGGSEMVCDPVVELFGCRVGGEAQDVST